MDATQAIETRVLTTLRLNGDELKHLCQLAMLDLDSPAAKADVLQARGWLSRRQLGWLVDWVQQWRQANAAVAAAHSSSTPAVPGPGPDIEVVVTPEQMELLVKIAALESQMIDTPICGWLDQTMRGLYARCIAEDAVVPQADESHAPMGYHLATDAEIQKKYGFDGSGIGRKAKLVQAMASACYGNQDAFIIADPDGAAFAFVDANYGAEARLVTDVLNTWS